MNKAIREFQAKKMIVFNALADTLPQIYPDRKDEIETILSAIGKYLTYLNEYNLYDYEKTVFFASKKFKELNQLMPTPSEVALMLNLDPNLYNEYQ